MIVVTVSVYVRKDGNFNNLLLPINHCRRCEICVLRRIAFVFHIFPCTNFVRPLNQFRQMLDKQKLILFRARRNGFTDTFTCKINIGIRKIHFAKNRIADRRTLQMLLIIRFCFRPQFLYILVLSKFIAFHDNLRADSFGAFILPIFAKIVNISRSYCPSDTFLSFAK